MEALGISSFLISAAPHPLSRPYGGAAVTARSSVSISRRFPRQHYFRPFRSFRRTVLSPRSALLGEVNFDAPQ